ncbi:hypothetical protein LINPERHAP1_LOCUS4960 [Linum perenne]
MQGWHLMQNCDPLWARLLKALYFPNSDFSHATKTRKPSWIWASLCDSREVLRLGARKNLINERSIHVHRDPWIPSLPGFRLSSGHDVSTMADEWLNKERDGWNREEVEKWCGVSETEATMRIPVGPPDGMDEWAWHFDQSGTFSGKSTYFALRKEIGTNQGHINTAPDEKK